MRICFVFPGIRMGFIMMQVQLCMLIHHFNFEAIDPEIKFRHGTVVLVDVNGIHLRIEKRNR